MREMLPNTSLFEYTRERAHLICPENLRTIA
jgi:hypothetical protein